ncbi:hypothetical protein SJAG_02807 [Schizosaccharomyces japonicus yFS275]|uniref:Inner centromere protein ARK-binding domain-containing protein n=1 Tax=Schizosaccharomyces japonicus (strain yFS275 / FY16936) TaxID=402676 RepID=B6K185_SCHJY|nr:hypothetical protein SJAG_02807 [Schizosaccharomyces japonicus yFS275]EEB07706.1 hypothetical protein SJAG_02807 [Schizosaccharomyces japonicus yFS275]
MNSVGSEPWVTKEIGYSEKIRKEKGKEFAFLVSETMDWLNEHMSEISKLQFETDFYSLVKTPSRFKAKYGTPALSPVRRCMLPTPKQLLASFQQQDESVESEEHMLVPSDPAALKNHQVHDSSDSLLDIIDNGAAQHAKEHEKEEEEEEVKRESALSEDSVTLVKQLTKQESTSAEKDDAKDNSTTSKGNELQLFKEKSHDSADEVKVKKEKAPKSPVSRHLFSDKILGAKRGIVKPLIEKFNKIRLPAKRKSEVLLEDEDESKSLKENKRTVTHKPQDIEADPETIAAVADLTSANVKDELSSSSARTSHVTRPFMKRMLSSPTKQDRTSPVRRQTTTITTPRSERTRVLGALTNRKTSHAPLTPKISAPVDAVLNAVRNSAAKDFQLAKQKMGSLTPSQVSRSPERHTTVINELPKIPVMPTYSKLSTQQTHQRLKIRGKKNSNPFADEDTNESSSSSPAKSSSGKTQEKNTTALTERLENAAKSKSADESAARPSSTVSEAGLLSRYDLRKPVSRMTSNSSKPVAIRIATASQRELGNNEKRKAKPTSSLQNNQQHQPVESMSTSIAAETNDASTHQNESTVRRTLPSRQMKTLSSTKAAKLRDGKDHSTASSSASFKHESKARSGKDHTGKHPEDAKSDAPSRITTSVSNTTSSWQSKLSKRAEEALRKRKMMTDDIGKSKLVLKPNLTRVASKYSGAPTRELPEDKSIGLHNGTLKKTGSDNSLASRALPAGGSVGAPKLQKIYENQEAKHTTNAQLSNYHSKVNMHLGSSSLLAQSVLRNAKKRSSHDNNGSNNHLLKTPEANIRSFGSKHTGSSGKHHRSPAESTSPLIPSEAIELPEIDSDYSDSSDDDEQKRKQKLNLPSWAESPELREQLRRQQKLDPDKIFGTIKPPEIEELFNSKDRPRSRFRPRSSSADWSSQDRLTQAEIEQYKKQMGYL